MSNYAEFTFRIFSTPLVNINAYAAVEEHLAGSITIYPSCGRELQFMMSRLNVREGYYELMSRRDSPLDYWYKFPSILVICGYDGNRYVFVGEHRYLKLLEPILILYVKRASIINSICDTCEFTILNTKTVAYEVELLGRRSNSLINYFLLPAYMLGRVERRFGIKFLERYYNTVVKKIPIFERKLISAALELVI